MEVLLLESEAFVRERHREITADRRAARHRNPPSPPLATSDDDDAADDVSSSAREGDELHRRQLLHLWTRAQALDTRWASSHLAKKLVVLRETLTPLYTSERLAALRHLSVANDSDNDSDAPCNAQPPDDAVPLPLEDLPPATQLALRIFFRFCASLEDPMRLAANARVLLQVAARLPTLLSELPAFPLSPGFAVAGDGESPTPRSVFQSLSDLFSDIFKLPYAPSKASTTKYAGAVGGVTETLSSSERSVVLTAYIALCLKWGSLRHLLCIVHLLLSEDPSTRTDPYFESLEPLFEDVAIATPEARHRTQQCEELVCGYLMSFGKGDHGKLGHGQCSHAACADGNCTENKLSPTFICATRDTQFSRIDSLSTHSVAITSCGEVMAWGNGDKYRLGHGSAAKEYTPKVVKSISTKGKVVDISCGLGHTIVLMETGEMYAWGNGSNGRLGLGDTNDRAAPTKVSALSVSSLTGVTDENDEEGSDDKRKADPRVFRHVYCGASHSLALGIDGRAYAWGKNNQGQCGLGHTNDQLSVEEVKFFRDEVDEDIVHAAGGWEHTLFCSASGRVFSAGCGYKDSRRAGIPPVLGHGDCERRVKPAVIQFFVENSDEIVQVACGWDHSMAISVTGHVYTWGSGANGKLGHGDEENCTVPTLIRGMESKHIRVAKAGCEHSVLLTADCEVWTFGQGDSGRLGHGNNLTRKVPTRIEAFAQGGLRPVAIAVGDKYNLVLVEDSHNEVANHHFFASTRPMTNLPLAGGFRDASHRKRRSSCIRRELEKRSHLESELAEVTASRYDSDWVLTVGDSIQNQQLNGKVPECTKSEEPEGSDLVAKRRAADEFLPRSRSECVLFLLGHIDRLAAAYFLEDSDTVRHVHDERDRNISEGELQSEISPLMLPFAIDTSSEAFHYLLQILQTQRLPLSPVSAGGAGKEDTRSLLLHRMCVVLACLRIIKANLSKLVGAGRRRQLNDKSTRLTCDHSSGNLDSTAALEQIHDLADKLASGDAHTILEFFAITSSGQNIREMESTVTAVSQEAAHILQVGFVCFYPQPRDRRKLLWDLARACRSAHEASRTRTLVLADRLCEADVMEELFVHLFVRDTHSSGESVSHSCWEPSAEFRHRDSSMHTTDIGDWNGDISIEALIKLMTSLVHQCSLDAIAHLEAGDESRYSPANNVSVRILAMLQVHFLGITQSFLSKCPSSENLSSDSVGKDGYEHTVTTDLVCSCVVDSLLAFIDVLATEAMAVLKKLHKASCHHEEVVAWRLNGSFFQTLLPNAIEALCVLVPLATTPFLSGESHVRPKRKRGLQFAHLLLPHLLPMSKMLDEVNWKMRGATDSNNQARHEMDDSSFNEQIAANHSWVIELEDACGILCGKLACVFVSQRFSTHFAISASDSSLHPALSNSLTGHSIPGIVNILQWERDGVFEIEDEILRSEGSKTDNCSESGVDSLSDSLFRIGFYLFHDLLRKLTISSTKCFLLEELVSAIKSKCERQHSNPTQPTSSDSPATLKPIENLYIRLAKIISADESSIYLKEKALVVWTIPLMQLGVSPDAAADVIAKSSIVSIIADALEDDFGVIEAYSSFISGETATNHSHELSSSNTIISSSHKESGVAARPFQNIKPVASLLYACTTPQELSHIAWTALCAIALQLNQSSVLATRSVVPLLAPAVISSISRSSSTKEIGSARSAMSPRKRLTLPKRNAVSTVHDSIDRVYEALFLLLAKAKRELELEVGSAQRLATFLSRAVATSQRDTADTTSTSKGQTLLLGVPTPMSSLAKQVVKFAKHPSAPETRQEAFSTDSNLPLALTICAWIYIEQTGSVSTRQLSVQRAAQMHQAAEEAMPELPVIFSLGNGSRGKPEGADCIDSETLTFSDAELLVFVSNIEATRVTLAVALKQESDDNQSQRTNASTWETILLTDEASVGTWIHFAFITEESEPRIFLNGKRSNWRTREASNVVPTAFTPKRLSPKPLLWVGGALQGREASVMMLDSCRSESTTPRKLASTKRHNLAGVVDDVLILNSSLTEQDVAWVAMRGPFLFQLKRQNVIKVHCSDILQVVCQLHCFGSSSSTGNAHATASALSARWVTLFVELLDIFSFNNPTQVDLRELLAETLPQIPPSLRSGISIRSLCRSLFKAIVDRHSSSNDTSVLYPNALIFAGGVRLIQSLWRSSLWKEEIDSLVLESASEEHDPLKTQSICSTEKQDVWQLAALCYALGGYPELTVNACTARYREQSLPCSFVPTRTAIPYSSHLATQDINGDSTAPFHLLLRLTHKLLSSAFEMPSRDSSASASPLSERDRALELFAIDERVALMTHLRASLLRFLMIDASSDRKTNLLWMPVDCGDGSQLQQQQELIDQIFKLASSSAVETVVSALGPDHKKAVRIRSVRGLLENLISPSKASRQVSSTFSIPQLEELAWDIWMSTSGCKQNPNEAFWWQENRSERQSFLEVLGGEVEIRHLTVKALEHFPTVCLSNVAIVASSGLWFYEVVVLSDGLMQIGYIDTDFAADPVQGQGVGDHTNSWGFDGYRCKKWNVNSSEYGVAWSADDVIGVLLDTDRMELSYFLNGKFLGVAFSGLPMTASSRMCPAASLNVYQAAQFNFGNPDSELLGFAHAPVLDSEQDQCRFQPVAAAMALDLKNEAKNHSDEAEEASDFSIQDMIHGGTDEIIDTSQSDCEDTEDADAKSVSELAEMLPGITLFDTLARDNRLDFLSSLQIRRQSASGTVIPGAEAHVKMHKTAQQLSSRYDEMVVDDELAMELSLSWQVYNSSGMGGLREAMLLPSLKNTATTSQNPALSQDLTASEAVLGCIALDNLLTLLYARHTLCHVLARAAHAGGVLNLVSRWCAQPDSSRRLIRSIRVLLCVERQEVMAELKHTAGPASAMRRSLEMQESVRALLKAEFDCFYESSAALVDRENTHSTPPRLQIFHAFFLEMKDQCVQLLALKNRDQDNNREGAWICAFWVMWLAEVILTPVEDQLQQLPHDGTSEFERIFASTCFGLPFFQILVDLASIGYTAPSFVAFTLMKRVLTGVSHTNHKGMPPTQIVGDTKWQVKTLEALVSAMDLQKTLELFGNRCRKEKSSRVFCSSLTTVMFELLAWRWQVIRYDHRDALPSSLSSESDDEVVEFRIESFSSTHATISWNQKLKPKDSSPDDISSSDVTAESTVLSLSVYQQPNLFHIDANHTAVRHHTSHVLPSKGSYTVRNLLPDTRYVFHLGRLQTMEVTDPSVSHTSTTTLENSESSQASEQLPAPDTSVEQQTALLKASVLVLQTPPEPVFQLDGDSMGKNLMLFNRNLSVKNLVNKKWHTVRASVGFDEGVHQWHVRIDTCVSKNIFIGVCTPQASLDNYIGSDGYGYGFLANKAVWHNKSKVHSYGEIFKQGDLLQVTLDCNAKTLAFSRNGEHLGIAATNLHTTGGGGTSCTYNSSTGTSEPCKWYPAFSMYNKDDQLTIIPPSTASSVCAHTNASDRPQNASVLDLLEAMEYVKTYENLEVASLALPASRKQLYAAAYSDFTAWSASEVVFREVDLGRLIRIDASPVATLPFGLSNGDSVLTPRGQATVLGVHNHELWFECDNDSSNDTPVLGTWSLHVCKQMLASPSEFPVHRRTHGLHKNSHHHQHHLYQSDLSDMDEQSEISTQQELSERESNTYEAFEQAQELWNGTQAYKDLDMMLVEILNEIASSRAMRGPQYLSYSDVSAELVLGEVITPLLEQLRAKINEGCKRKTQSLILARIGLLLFVNRNLYNTARIAVTEPMRPALFQQAISPSSACMKKNAAEASYDRDEGNDDGESTPERKKEGADGSYVVTTDFLATLSSAMASNRYGHSSVDVPNTFAAWMLFSTQKSKFITEMLQRTTTPTLNTPVRDLHSHSADHAITSAFDDTYDPSDLPRVSVRYPERRHDPFWRSSTVSCPRSTPFVMSRRSRSESLFTQVSRQLQDMSPRDWRRAYSTPFEPLPTTRAFHVTVIVPVESNITREGVGSGNKTHNLANLKADTTDLIDGAKMTCSEELGTEFDKSAQQPTLSPASRAAAVTAAAGTLPFQHHLQSQATRYARLLEDLLTEVQSPAFPLFAPVSASADTRQADRDKSNHESIPDLHTIAPGGAITNADLALDVNTALLAPEVIAQSSLAPEQVLRWFFQLGQIFGLAWRGSILLPLQFVSNAFWEDLVDAKPFPPSKGPDLGCCDAQDGDSRLAILEAIREGLFSVIPSRCISLLASIEVKIRLSDPNDVFAIETLQRHAEFNSELRHHAMFWELVSSFTAVERRALLLFLMNDSSSRSRRSNASRRNRSSAASESAVLTPESPPFVLEISGDVLADSQSHPDACYPVVVAVSELRCRLHLPTYSSMDTMRKKLTLAMTASSYAV